MATAELHHRQYHARGRVVAFLAPMLLAGARVCGEMAAPPADYTACLSPSALIPDAAAGLSCDMVLRSAGGVGRMVVRLDISHRWVGDLSATLTHLETGTTATLLDRPGYPVGSDGCQRSDVFVYFDDGAERAAEDACGDGLPTLWGHLRPATPLSIFRGEGLDGTWRLTVTDGEEGAVGTLHGWCIYVDHSGLPEPTQPPAPGSVYLPRFEMGAPAWHFGSVAGVFTPPLPVILGPSPTSYWLVSQDNANTFGWWESPWFEAWPPPDVPGPGMILLGQFTLGSSLSAADQVPTVRLRGVSEMQDQGTVLSVESNGDAAFSPTTEGEVLPMYWVPSTGSPRLSVAFDLLNLGGMDAANASVWLSRVSVVRLPWTLLDDFTTEQVFTFEEDTGGLAWHELEEEFDVAEARFDAVNGRLGFRSTPHRRFEYGSWDSPEPPTDGWHVDRQRLYVADFFIEADAVTPAHVPGFRLRVNETQGRASQSLVVTPANSPTTAPTIGNPRTYHVLFPGTLAPGGQLTCSLDCFEPAGGTAPPGSGLSVTRIAIRSIPLPGGGR